MQPGEDEIDYRETDDVTRVHGAVKREHKEPEAGTVPVPVWWFAIVIMVTFGAAFYFGQYDGGLSGEVYNESEGRPGASGKAGAAGEGEVAAPLTLAQKGKRVYSQNCLACHQGNGQGLAGTYPPIGGSPWVVGDTRRLAAVVLKGMQGPHEVGGVTYNGAMPAWGGVLDDERIASVISYIRSEFGNDAPEVTPEQVAVVRAEFATHAEPFSHEELVAITGDIPGGSAPAGEPAAPAAE